MDISSRKLAWPFGAVLLVGPYLLRLIQALGDIDTACNISGSKSDTCGSSVMVAFILSPPVWMVSISVIAALIWFWYIERKREKLSLEKLDKLHKDFWAFSAKVEERLALLESGCQRTENALRESITEIASDAATAAAHNVKDKLDKDFKSQANELRNESSRRIGALLGDLQNRYSELHSSVVRSVRKDIPSMVREAIDEKQ